MSSPIPPSTPQGLDSTNANNGIGNPNSEEPEIQVSQAISEAVLSGRGIRRLVTLCGTIRELVQESDRRLFATEGTNIEGNELKEGGQSPEDLQEMEQRRNRAWRSYQALLKFVPEFRQKTLTRSEVSRRMYYRHLTTGANAARSDDINRVKSKVAEWINARPGIAESQRLVLSKKIGRGLQNDMTGGLLCPVRYDWDDLSIRGKIHDEVDGHSASADFWIRCLYQGEKGDSADVEKGFLKGQLLVKTFKVIFTSPSSAEDPEDAPHGHGRWRHRSDETGPPRRPNNAEKLGMGGRVTPRAIAYAAVQLHFVLTDATHWMPRYSGFNYEEFYEFIIDYFEADETPQAQEISAALLEWWNKEVFPGSPATRAVASVSA